MINIVAVGKVSAGYYGAAIDEYIKRLKAYSKVNIIEINEYKLSGNSDKDILKVLTEEGRAIISQCKGYVIALDIKGDLITSEQLADTIQNKFSSGQSDITFVIGGSYGLSSDVLVTADKRISMGRLTYPHQLVRVILSEQIYRAFSIINNSKYHK